MADSPLHPPTTLPPNPGDIPGGCCQSCGLDLTSRTVGEVCPQCARPILGRCRGCGYDLAGLPVAGKCPECGKPLADSLRGDLLAFAEPGYVATLHRGVVFVLASILFVVCSIIGGFLFFAVLSATAAGSGAGSFASLAQWGTAAVGLISSGLSVYGWYLFSTPDPGVHILDRGDRPRQVLRIAVVVSAAIALLSSVIQLIEPASARPGFSAGATMTGFAVVTSLVLTVAGFAAWIVQFFAAMRYLQWIAPRLPSAKHAKTAGRYMWLLPVLYVPGAILCGLGPILALIFYYNLLNEFRKSLKAIRDRHAPSPSPM